MRGTGAHCAAVVHVPLLVPEGRGRRHRIAMDEDPVLALQACLQQLKAATSFEEAKAVAFRTMELRKTASNQSVEFRSLVAPADGGLSVAQSGGEIALALDIESLPVAP